MPQVLDGRVPAGAGVRSLGWLTGEQLSGSSSQDRRDSMRMIDLLFPLPLGSLGGMPESFNPGGARGRARGAG